MNSELGQARIVDLELSSLFAQAHKKYQLETEEEEKKERLAAMEMLRAYIDGKKSFSDLPGYIQRRIALLT